MNKDTLLALWGKNKDILLVLWGKRKMICYLGLLVLSFIFMLIEGDATAFMFLTFIGVYILFMKKELKVEEPDKSSRHLHGL